MYCVKCGVRLQDGVERCPLCATPVWNPAPHDRETEHGYPEALPGSYRESRMPTAIALTIVCALTAAAIVAICFSLYGQLRWGGYAALGVALFYITAVLPAWFRNPAEEIFVAADWVAVALFALYVCGKTGGSWFLPFAFPVSGLCCVLSVTLICLLKYVRKGRLFIFGGFLILLGGAAMLTEFFEHLTFGTRMFRWSLYPLVCFGAAGMFLLLAGIIKPLKNTLMKRFYY